MSDVLVAISTVTDGSMYNRHDPTDAEVIQNRIRFLKQHNLTLEQSTRLQIKYEGNDYCRYRLVTPVDQGAGMRENNPIFADALITTTPGHVLMLPVADCVGATLYDPEHHVLLLAHLGRHSLEQQGGKRSVEFLTKHYQTNPKMLRVWLTPAPNKTAYPIWALNNQGMKEAALEQLHSAGIPNTNITDNPADTVTDLNYFSYSEFLKGNRDIDADYAMIAVMPK